VGGGAGTANRHLAWTPESEESPAEQVRSLVRQNRPEMGKKNRKSKHGQRDAEDN